MPTSSRAWVPKLVARLAPGSASSRTSRRDQQDGGLQAYVEIDRAAASRYGITPAMIDNALYNAFGQRIVSTIFTQTNQYRVVLEVQPEFRQGVAALDGIYVAAPNAATAARPPGSAGAATDRARRSRFRCRRWRG